MKVTKATIKKTIKELGFKVEDFQIEGGSVATIETALFKEGKAQEKGNKQVQKVVKTLSKQGADYYGFKTGYGAWFYRFQVQSWSSKLASMNID